MRAFCVPMIFAVSMLLPVAVYADPGAETSLAVPAQNTAASPTVQPVGARVLVSQATVDGNKGVDLDEIVCRSQPPATGTRLGGGRECHTLRQWNDRERQDQRTLQQRQIVGSYTGETGMGAK
ncbi:MAG TPA: hypothetical protein VGK90_11205 [Rhizomicrobium sp.]|jgi:hypothetical protein